MMCVFYVELHPLVIASPDDWTYISYSRQAWPMKGAWNPGKVLPETIGGLVGNLSAFLVYPILGDYIRTFSICYGIFFAALAAAYITAFASLVKKCFSLDHIQTLFIAFVFFALNFQLCKVRTINNNHLLSIYGINLGINYSMPTFVCAIMAFYIIKCVAYDDYLNTIKTYDLAYALNMFRSFKSGILFLFLYLCIFSNLITNGTLLAVLGAAFIQRICNDIKTGIRRGFKNWFWRYSAYIAAFVMDLLCGLFELTGGNADLHDDFSLSRAISEYPSTVKTVIDNINKPTFLTIIVIIALSLAISFSAKQKGTNDAERLRKMLIITLSALLIDFIYVSIISIRVGGYIASGMVYNGILIWVVSSGVISCAYIISKIAELRAYIPIIAFILLFVVINIPDNVGNGFGLGDRLYGDNSSAAFYYEESNSLLEQFIDADKNGVESFTLYSKGAVGDCGQWAAYRVRRTLLRHGLIHNVMEVDVQKTN